MAFLRRTVLPAVLPAVLLLSAVVAVPVSAYADTYRTATSTGSGATRAAGAANAEANARAELNRQAAQAGEVCPSVSVSSSLVYTAPDGSAYVYQATASGTCVTQTPAPQPSYPVPRSETRQAGGSTPSAAVQAGSQAARAAILAAGGSCTGWTTTSALVWAAPDSSWHVYDVTVSASCTN
ncbi:hypothetical protein [Nonomuraea wenchangensis]|uniref:hypothetical protein n=1 Tax=Nonomuraea wenchangensis TaxID=568860 RepID=UPI0033C17FFF